jgi:aspartate kinase
MQLSGPVVMKFGGTSVADADAIRRLTSIVAARRQNAGTIVVVSAMSGVTDRLLSLAAAAERREATSAEVESLWQRHMIVVRALVEPETASALEVQLARHFDELRALLDTGAILRSVPPAALDAIASTGELLSSRIVAAALNGAGSPATWADARAVVITDDAHASGVPRSEETRVAASAVLSPVLADGRIAVIGGYVGATAAGVTTTLGRGGSDYSAAIIGAAVEAGEIQIWTDVDGMLTADPRIIQDAKVVPHLSFGEASELAYFGAKVLHPDTILPALARQIPVRVLNSRRPDGPGTLITATAPASPRPLAAVACKRRITVVEITSTRMLMTYGFLRRVFEIFERCRTAVDVVTTSEVSVSVTVDDDGRLPAIVEGLREFAEVNVERDMAILSAVGDNLSADSRIAARVIGALQDFPVRMVSQAASRRNVTIVLRDGELPQAMRQLHSVFFDGEDRSLEAADREYALPPTS